MDKKAARNPTAPTTPVPSSWPRSAGISLWVLLVILGFWGPYLHLPVSMSLLTGLYGLFVLVAAATTALGLLRRGDAGAK